MPPRSGHGCRASNEFAVQQQNQCFGIFLFAQCQVAKEEDGVTGL
jgi:hypothetical protein